MLKTQNDRANIISIDETKMEVSGDKDMWMWKRREQRVHPDSVGFFPKKDRDVMFSVMFCGV